MIPAGKVGMSHPLWFQQGEWDNPPGFKTNRSTPLCKQTQVLFPPLYGHYIIQWILALPFFQQVNFEPNSYFECIHLLRGANFDWDYFDVAVLLAMIRAMIRFYH